MYLSHETYKFCPYVTTGIRHVRLPSPQLICVCVWERERFNTSCFCELGGTSFSYKYSHSAAAQPKASCESVSLRGISGNRQRQQRFRFIHSFVSQRQHLERIFIIIFELDGVCLCSPEIFMDCLSFWFFFIERRDLWHCSGYVQ